MTRTLRAPALAVAALLVALPTTMLVVRWVDQGSRPTTELPASWQMYSAVAPASYTGVDGRGRRRALDVGPLPPVVREIDSGTLLPRLLCERHDDLVAVRRTGGPEPGAFAC